MVFRKLFNPNAWHLKTISLTLVLIIIGEIVFPSVASAMTTNGPTQPEVFGFQPVDATDNVSLTTGAFNYTIPITSIPEYPMAISYRSSINPGQEAGVFGYGFHGFSGAIGRSMMGLPDDMRGALRTYNYQNQKRWSADVGVGVGISIPALQVLGIGANVNIKGGYDNYTGAYGSISFGLSAGVGVELISNLNIGLGVGLGLSSDSRSTSAIIGGGVGLGLSYGKSESNRFLSKLTVPGSLAYAGFSQKIGDKSSTVYAASTLLTAGVSNFSFASGNFSQTLASLSNVVPVNKGWGLSISVSIPIGGAVSLSLSAGYTQSELDYNNISKKVFGFQYLSDIDRRDDSHLADFTIEGENSFPDGAEIKEKGHDPRVNPSFLQRDYFVANAMGLGGTMQLHQEQYGVVSRGKSRTQYRDIGVLEIKTSRYESFPWAHIDQAEFNAAVDILKLLKGGKSENDFDAVMFKQVEKASLTEAQHTFGKSRFKMRGDMTGEFNLASEDFKDHEPNAFELQKVQGSGGKVSGFMRTGKKVALYEPKAKQRTQTLFDGAGEIERSTVINHKTLGEVVSSFQAWKKDEPAFFSEDGFKLKQSFYSHKRIEQTGTQKAANVHLNEHVTDFNILEHLESVQTNSASDISSVVASIEVQNASGLKYIFGLPAFAKETEIVMLKGKGKNPPVKRGDDYFSFSDKERNKVTIKDRYEYAYAWMLTAIVGEDYVDFDDIPGPSDGDLGYWVKFKYTKTADNYRWRYPFTGMSYMPNTSITYGDDSYNMTTGFKEVYVLSEVESANYVCRYNYQKRFDGLDAKERANGVARNPVVEGDLDAKGYFQQYKEDPTGNNFQYAVTGIDLYKKHPQGDNSAFVYNKEPGKKVKSTVFEYDYSISSMVPNNLGNYLDVKQGSLSYHYNARSGEKIGTGRLTLRKIQHIAYDKNGNAEPLPSYNLSYWADRDEAYNPPYNDRLSDMWGNYNKRAGTSELPIPNSNNAKVRLYHSYCEYDPEYAEENARVWQLKEVNLPSGGKLDVTYKGQSYTYVETKEAYVMRRLSNRPESLVDNGKTTFVSVDVSDICRDELAEGNTVAGLKGLNKSMKPGDKMYGEICFYQTDERDPGKIFVAGAEIDLVSISSEIVKGSDNSYYQTLEVKASPDAKYSVNKDRSPFFSEIEKFMYAESEQATCVRQSLPMKCSNVESQLAQMDNLGKATPLDAVERAIANFRNIFTGDGKFKGVLDDCFGKPGSFYISELSFIRTPVYKGKYTGTRVKSLSYDDRFQYGTALSGEQAPHSSQYGSVYYYDENSDGTGRSAGVATIEPVGGKSAVIDVNELVGRGYLPSAAIISSKTTLAGLYKDTDALEGQRSRAKGKTVYEFYTPKDKGLNYIPSEAIKTRSEINTPMNPQGTFAQTGMLVYFLIKIKIFRKRITIKIPMILPISIIWNQKHEYHMQSYSYLDYTDIYGRPKSVTQLNASDMEDGKQEFKYYDVDEAVPVYKEGFEAANLKKMRPGKMDQAWSEAWYSKETDLSLIPWILFFNARTTQHNNYINMKYSYVPPVMKEVITTVDGQKTITHNSGFDYYTGTPIEVRSNDSYGNEKIKRTVPAYWEYPSMGPIQKNERNNNNLTAKAGSYLYLNETDKHHLLGASVTRWDKSAWDVAGYLQPERRQNDDGSYRYVYNKVSGSTLKSVYSAAQRNKDKHIKRNSALYRPVETYTYETGLTVDGVFESFTPFNYSGVNGAAWKLVSKSELFDANGVLLQAADVLQKQVSQHMGYNFSKAISVVANASYHSSFYDGAENTYEVNGQLVLENDRVKLGDATIYKGNCEALYSGQTLHSIDYLKGNRSLALDLLLIKKGLAATNKPLGKVAVTFVNGLERSLFLSIDEQQRYRLTSNWGEDFGGFVVLPGGNGQEYLLFDLDRIATFSVSELPGSGVNIQKVRKDLSGPYLACTDFPVKSYRLPESDCAGDVHTGEYAFSLKGGNTGTIITLTPQQLGAKEYARQFKALVWVMKTSATGIQMVVRYTDLSNNVSEEVVTPVQAIAQAGNWLLLRHNFDLKTANGNDTKQVEVFMRNSSAEGLAIYDDIRVLPYHAEMSNYVYDAQFDRVTSTLDADNFATFNEYDIRGRLIRSAVEIDGIGRKTIRQILYNDQKDAE